MTILAIDTAGKSCSVAVRCFSSSQHETFEEHALIERGHSEKVITQIQSLVEKQQLKLQDIKKILVTVGPGSFTGVRVGVALARGLALGTGAQLFGGHSTFLTAVAAHLAWQQDTNEGADDGCDFFAENNRYLSVINAGRGEFYIQVVGLNNEVVEAICEPQLIRLAEAADIVMSHDIRGAIGPDAALFKDSVFETREISPFTCHEIVATAQTLFEVDSASFLEGDAVKPLYLRAPDAVPQEHKALARSGS